MIEIISVFLLLALLFGGLLLEGYIHQGGGTMEERRAVVFEIYRYAVCFIMVIIFGLMTFQLIGSLLGGASEPNTLAGPGVGVLLSIVLFAAHWLMKNPVLPKA